MDRENLMRQIIVFAADPLFCALSELDVQKMLTAVDLCGISFGAGSKLAEDLNYLLSDDWPVNKINRF
jgi:hypothetical protein